MQQARLWILSLTGVGLLTGLGLAYWRPATPLLAYWLLLAMGLGLAIALTKRFSGIQSRLGTLVWTFGALIAMALITTQLAARRAISSTHLVYHGVHVVGVDSLTIGAGPNTTDIRLQTVTSAQLPWSITLNRTRDGWELNPVYGVEQLRVRHGSTDPIGSEYSVARSAVLEPDDSITVIGPDGEPVDILTLTRDGLETATGSHITFDAGESSLHHRNERRLASGTALANLNGERSGSSVVYERFVRVQRLSDGDVINGTAAPLLARVIPGSNRYLISAAPPYTLSGGAMSGGSLVVGDSAFVEVRSADATWRFALLTGFRREPGAQRGVAVLFDRSPRPLDTPLPVGLSCPESTACGAISLRRLPAPVAHVALDNAGFDTERYGLLGMLRVSDAGYDVVLPRGTHAVERGRDRPVAVPVTSLPGSEEAEDESRYVLLGAEGQSDTMAQVIGIGLGLMLLLGAIHSVVRSLTVRGFARPTRNEERAITAGLAALLGLVLTRVTVGARVAFFDPFLERGIETAVGLCSAMAVVVVGLLTWKTWLPPFLAGSRCAFAGRSSPMSVLRGLMSWASSLIPESARPQAGRAALLTAVALTLLTYTTGYSAWYGLFAGFIVILVWVCLAWVAAFTGDHFDTYERGAHAVVEQLSPARPARATNATRDSRLRRFAHTPEIAIIGAALVLVLAHMLPQIALPAALITIAGAFMIVWRRRSGRASNGQPDHVAALAGVATFGAIIAALRLVSENGSIGAFVLVVFVVLASVRIGRAVGARIASRTADERFAWLRDSVLLAAPMLLLVPFAAIDMGLVLVLVIPLASATLLATGARAAGARLILPALVLALALGAGKKVVFPATDDIRDADSHAAQASAFTDMSKLIGLRLPILATPMDRAAARSVATRDPELAERLLIAAGPGPARDLLIPSIEQIWGTRAYARAGWWGEGLGQAVVGGRGVAEVVSYAENTFSVFVLGEHGAVGGMLVLMLYLLLAVAVGVLMLARPGDTQSYRASRALFLVAALIVVFPAAYVALSNVGAVPITGQNMPFLGLNAWSDVAISAGVIGILITGALRGLEERAR
ncbi:MAG TPA: hypothetical protein VK912_08670 [Longimicrobiales bacterium]|nr:hypothetical protein [Longimicrobiales bacterium]